MDLSAFDIDLRELIRAALSGETSAVSFEEAGGNRNKWTATGAPVRLPSGGAAGAVVNLTAVRERYENASPSLALALSQTEFLGAMPGMLFVSDAEGRCVDGSEKFFSAMKYSRDEVVGHLFKEFLRNGDSADADEDAAAFVRALREEVWDVECRVETKDGDVLSLSLTGARLRWAGEERTLVSCADNTKLRRTEEQLRRVSVTDASTGILNRQGMERVLMTEIERAARYRGSLSLIMLDIDGFRQMNERLGYAVSDKVLRELTAAVKSRVHLTDFLGRWGGDEFMVLTPAPPAAAAQLAEKLRDMAKQTPLGGNNRLTLSAGVATLSRAMDISSFVGAAYDAMIEAKRDGGDRVALAGKAAPEGKFESITES